MPWPDRWARKASHSPCPRHPCGTSQCFHWEFVETDTFFCLHLLGLGLKVGFGLDFELLGLVMGLIWSWFGFIVLIELCG